MGELVYVSDVSPYAGRDGERVLAGVHRSLGSAAAALEEIAELSGLCFRQVTRAADASPELLGAARVLALFTIGETPWSASQRAIIESRTSAGELGVIGIHSATDSAYGWECFGQLMGARFDGHPITAELSIAVTDPDHPSTRHLSSPWRFREELYLFRELVSDAHVLLGAELGGGFESDSRSLAPLAWCIERGRCRSFYTALGHFHEAYEDVNYLRHLHGGVDWVLAGQ